MFMFTGTVSRDNRSVWLNSYPMAGRLHVGGLDLW